MDRKILLSPPPPPLQYTDGGSSLSNNVSPSVLLIIIILAIIFFISGLLHLLVRFLLKPSNRDPDDFDNVTALQGQLQQLFTLHDSGVDQSFIDTLPVFTYKTINGVKTPFDCAVCLCEFEGDDSLRLLPKCSHAFHMDCIDTWLLSHSTCPLCRSNLLFDYSPNTCSPLVLVLESGRVENSREIVADPIIQRVNSQFSVEESEFAPLNLGQNEVKEEENKDKVVTIKLGKFKNVDRGGSGDGGGDGDSGGCGGGGDEKSNIDGRRCFSMGSFEYVMDDNASLHVQIRTQIKKQTYKKSNLPITAGHRPAMSECGGDSSRDLKGIEAFRSISGGSIMRESFSMSKIWLRGRKEKPISTAAMAAAIEPPPTRTHEITPSGNSLDPQAAPNPPSLARSSLIWLMCRQKTKVVHSSLSLNV